MERKPIVSHQQLEVYQMAFEAAMTIFRRSKTFPAEERYSLTDQIRRASRSVCANLAEAWRKRRYEAAFIAKLNDAEAEAAETQTWLQFSVECQYLDSEEGRNLYQAYNHILGKLVILIKNHPPLSLSHIWGTTAYNERMYYANISHTF
jgi:four helix bundle protein